jgi:hypothetical protein
MPKLTEQAIKWDMWSEVYDYEDGHYAGYEIIPDGQAWFSIFELQTCHICSKNVSSIRFQGKNGHFTARRELRNGGKDAYWYAYRKEAGKLVKQYLGKTTELTVARLESVAENLKTRLRQDSLDSGEVETSSDTPHSLQYRIVTEMCSKYGKSLFSQVKHPVRCEWMMLYAVCIDLWDSYGWMPIRLEPWLQFAQTR